MLQKVINTHQWYWKIEVLNEIRNSSAFIEIHYYGPLAQFFDAGWSEGAKLSTKDPTLRIRLNDKELSASNSKILIYQQLQNLLEKKSPVQFREDCLNHSFLFRDAIFGREINT